MAEQKDSENKENKLKQQMADMSLKDQRRIERDIKLQKKVKADLEPERVLKEEIDQVKRKVGSTSDVYIERMRGYVQVEGREDE